MRRCESSFLTKFTPDVLGTPNFDTSFQPLFVQAAPQAAQQHWLNLMLLAIIFSIPLVPCSKSPTDACLAFLPSSSVTSLCHRLSGYICSGHHALASQSLLKVKFAPCHKCVPCHQYSLSLVSFCALMKANSVGFPCSITQHA